MFLVGIDVAKDKHDCFICDSEGNVLKDFFTFSNDRHGFHLLLSFLPSSSENVKVGLEATEHYRLNLINFLIDNGYSPVVFNPLQIIIKDISEDHTNPCTQRKSKSNT